MTESMRSCIKGLILSLFGSPLPAAPSREPVAYLYNGVRLPGLPEWDREMYPYVMMADMTKSGVHDAIYCYFLSSKDGQITDPDTLLGFVYSSKINYGICVFEKTQPEDGWSDFNDKRSATFGVPFWANFEVLNADGSVYLAASEPVPVYE